RPSRSGRATRCACRRGSHSCGASLSADRAVGRTYHDSIGYDAAQARRAGGIMKRRLLLGRRRRNVLLGRPQDRHVRRVHDAVAQAARSRSRRAQEHDVRGGVEVMPRRLLVLVALAVTCTGCVSVKDTPLDQRAIPKITGQDVVVVKRPLPDFGAMTAGKISAGALFGPLGGAVAGAAMISAGNELVKEHAIDDPAYAIAEELARSLAASSGIRSVP